MMPPVVKLHSSVARPGAAGLADELVSGDTRASLAVRGRGAEWPAFPPGPAGCPAAACGPPAWPRAHPAPASPAPVRLAQPEQHAPPGHPGFRGGGTSAARSEAEYLIGRERRTAVLRRARPRPLLPRPHEPRRASPGRGLRRRTFPHRAARRVAPRTRPRGRCCPGLRDAPGPAGRRHSRRHDPRAGQRCPGCPRRPVRWHRPGRRRPWRPVRWHRPGRSGSHSRRCRSGAAGLLPQFGSEPGLVRADEPGHRHGPEGSQRIAPIRSPARRDRRLQRRQPGTVSRHLGQTSHREFP